MSSQPQAHKDEHEPISGAKGPGTAQQPFDQGNDEEQASVRPQPDVNKSGGEPVSGVTGKGTTDQPFDAGNDENVQEKMKS